jgi:hypothetical protein
MNEIEKAITYFEALLERLGNGDSDNAVCATALAALREKQERDKGCDLCMPVNTMKSMGAYGRKFMYCPMCGKELEVEP